MDIKDTTNNPVKNLVKRINLFVKLNFLYGWSGNFRNWKEANAQAKGYDSSLIVDKVKAASLQVKDGKAAFERDSVLFYSKEYPWPLTAALFWIAAQNEGKLSILDFGGSLGSTYYQHRDLLETLREVRWCIVEQKDFVEIGKSSFEDANLKFYFDMESCLRSNSIHAVLLGCVLPYLEHPFAMLQKIADSKIPFLIIDRMPFIEGTMDRLTVQKVPPEIYQASYPAWFFGYDKFMSFIKQYYVIVAEYYCDDRANIKSTFKGLILKLHQ